MKKNISIKLKAAFLLTVFALNTVVAFACSMGLNMGYNEKHHHNKKEEKVASAHSHSHSPGTTPHHHSSTASHSHGSSHKHSHAGDGSYDHHDGSASHDSGAEKPEDDDCCRDSAVKFQKEDKRPQQPQNTAIKAPVFVAFLSAFLGLELAPEKTTAGTKFLVPRYYPPPDIRIAIQSFLI